MKNKDLKEMTVEQLQSKALEMRKSLFELKMKNKVGQLNNPIEVRDARKTVARILTAINSQALATTPAPKAVKAKAVKAKASKSTKTTKTKKK